MNVQAPENRRNKEIILAQVGKILIPKDGIIDVPENLGKSLIANLGFTESVKPPTPPVVVSPKAEVKVEAPKPEVKVEKPEIQKPVEVKAPEPEVKVEKPKVEVVKNTKTLAELKALKTKELIELCKTYPEEEWKEMAAKPVNSAKALLIKYLMGK
jgi:outer membrane biosynthesis protein TonB